MKSIENNFDHPQVNELLTKHFVELRSVSPEGSAHVLDISGLKIPSIRFWSLWEKELMGKKANIAIVSNNKDLLILLDETFNLLKKFGFKSCKPFAHYKEDPNSCYYNLEL